MARENGKVVEYFLGIVHASEINAKALTECTCFHSPQNLWYRLMEQIRVEYGSV